MARTIVHGPKPVEAIEALLCGTSKLCYYIDFFLLVPCVDLLVRFQKLRAILEISFWCFAGVSFLMCFFFIYTSHEPSDAVSA